MPCVNAPVQIHLFKVLPSRSASCILAFEKLAPERLASSSLVLVRSASSKLAFSKLNPERSIPDRVAFAKIAPFSRSFCSSVLGGTRKKCAFKPSARICARNAPLAGSRQQASKRQEAARESRQAWLQQHSHTPLARNVDPHKTSTHGMGSVRRELTSG